MCLIMFGRARLNREEKTLDIMKNTSLIKKAFLDTLPVMTGYVVLGMGFGIILKTKGYGVFWALAMSVFIYAGSMQYLAVSLLTSGASLIATAITTFMVNARHLFYGISMIDKYKGAGARKPYMIFALTDETYSLVCSQELDDSGQQHDYIFLVSLFNQCYWVAGSVLGAWLGSAIPFSVEGIDFALTALFITIFVEQWNSTKEHMPAIIGVTISAACVWIFGPDRFLIPAMCFISAAVALLKKKEERQHD